METTTDTNLNQSSSSFKKEKEKEENEEKKTNDETFDPPPPDASVFGSNRTRGTNIFLLLVVLMALFWSIAILIWSLDRAGSSTMEETSTTNNNNNNNNNNLNSASSIIKSPISTHAQMIMAGHSTSPNYLLVRAGGSVDSSPKSMGTQLTSADNTEPQAVHFLETNQMIVSEDETKRLLFDVNGEAFLQDITDSNNIITYWRSRTPNQGGIKFIVSTQGTCYILRVDGSRVYTGESLDTFAENLKNVNWKPSSPSEEPVYWMAPNCRLPRYQNCNPDDPFIPCMSELFVGTTTNKCYQSVVYGPFTLRFGESALELVSISEQNNPYYKGTPKPNNSPNMNLQIYPQLSTDSLFPIPLWIQPYHLSEDGQLPPSSASKNLNFAQGSCCTSKTPLTLNMQRLR